MDNQPIFKCGIGGCLFATKRRSDLTRHRRKHTTDGSPFPPTHQDAPHATIVGDIIPTQASMNIGMDTINTHDYSIMMKRLPGQGVSISPSACVYNTQYSPISAADDEEALDTAMDPIPNINSTPNNVLLPNNCVLTPVPITPLPDSDLTEFTTTMGTTRNSAPSTDTNTMTAPLNAALPSGPFTVMDQKFPVTLPGEIYYTGDGLNFTKIDAEMGDKFQLTPVGLTKINNVSDPPSQQVIIKGSFSLQFLSYDKE
jgi:hypothetical protein